MLTKVVVVMVPGLMRHFFSPDVSVFRDPYPVFFHLSVGVVVESLLFQNGRSYGLAILDTSMFSFFRDSFSYVRVDGRVFEEIVEMIVNDSSTIGSFYARLGTIVFALWFSS